MGANNRSKSIAVSLGLALALYLSLKLTQPLFANWGATQEEILQPYPPSAHYAEYYSGKKALSTHAVTIHATPDAIWPWIVQIGADRGGFYSYSTLENLFLGNVKNATRIEQKWQNLKVGDPMVVHPLAPPMTVRALETHRYVAFDSWVFRLKPVNSRSTRLVASIYAYSFPNPSLSADLLLHSVFYEFAHFIMERKMLLSIKERAEGTVAF